MDIRTRVTIIQPCCGLSFFFPSTQHTHTHPPSGLFANATTLLGEMYASCAEPPPIDLCCWFAFSFSRLSWMDLLFIYLFFFFAWPFGSNKHSAGADACPLLSPSVSPTGFQQKQPDPGGKKQVLQPPAGREDLHQRILH